ncbi:MAG: LuxR family transcriptional regulator [Pseudomonadota bacterium]
MRKKSPSLELERFSVQLQATYSFDALSEAFIEFFGAEGVEMMSYHHLPPPGASDYQRSITVAAYGFPPRWVDRYVDDELHKIDPIPRHALDAVRPFWWSDAQHFRDLSNDEAWYLGELSRAGVGDGIAMALFGPHGRNGYAGLGFGSKSERWGDEKVARLHIAAQLGHQQYCYLLAAAAPENISLSERESQILRWVARGKSNASVSQILGISPNTVDTYMRRIYDKLDVADRVTASLRGVALGLID